MNRHSWKKIAFEIILIFLISLTPLLWFRPGALMVGHDLVTPLEPKTFLAGRLFTWNNQFFGQSQVLILGTILVHFIDAIPSYLGFSLQSAQKLVYIFWFFLIGVSAYVLAHVLKPRNSFFKFAVVLFYQFNFFILQGWWIAEKSKFSAYIAAPLILAIFLLVESRRLAVVPGAILNSFILFFFNASGLYGVPLYGGLFVIIGCYFVFVVLNSLIIKNFRSVRRLVSLTITTGVLALLFNSYFVLPAVFRLRSQLTTNISQVGGISGIISWADEISANTSFLNLMRLQGIPEWYDNPEHPYAKIFLSNLPLIGISFLWPLLIFASLYLVRERASRRLVLYFFLVYLVGMFFAAGTHPPLGFLYQLLVEKIPGFIIFRSPYFKFAPALFLSSAVLVAFVVDSLSSRIRRKAFAIFFVILLIYHFPFFSGNFFQWREGYSTRLSVPTYVFEFGKWLREQPDSSRVLMVPPNSPDLQYSLYTWGYLSFQALPTLMSNASVIVNNDKLNSEERNLTMVLYDAIASADREKIERLLSLLQISHVVVTRDADTNIKSSLALDASRYMKGIETSGLFEKEREFGQWHVYRVRKQPIGILFAVGTLPVIDATTDDVALYMSHTIVPHSYARRKNETADQSPTAPLLIVPQCANCLKKSRAVITFPERNILPGDPFYSLALLSERLRKVPEDPKSAIYNTLGISLKRISEINEMLFAQKPLTKDIVDRYLALLEAVEKNFDRLPSPQERLEVGGDIAHYLRSQRNFLRPNLGKYVTGGPQTVLTGSLFSAIHKTEKMLEPFLSPLSDENSRLYHFTLDASGTFEILLRESDVAELKSAKNVLRVTIDGTTIREITIDEAKGTWVSFGTIALKQGFHTLMLTLPESVQAAYALEPTETEFSAADENNCFGTYVNGVTSGKLYKSLIRYFNDFSDNLLFFGWEKGREGQRLLFSVMLPVSPFEATVEQIFDLSPGVTELTLAACAPNLTKERADTQFHLQIGEAIYPALFLTNTQPEEQTIVPLTYRTQLPTRYEVQLPENASFPMTVVFAERFDPWWELHGIESEHIKVNDYANGWIIDRPAGSTLILEYKGEKYRRWGALLTLLTFTCGALLLRRHWRRL